MSKARSGATAQALIDGLQWNSARTKCLAQSVALGFRDKHLDAGNEDAFSRGVHAGRAGGQPEGGEHDVELHAGDVVIPAEPHMP